MKEIENIGFNLLTFSTLILATLSIAKIWYITKQGRKIWKEKSGKSVSLTWIFFIIFLHLAGGVFGIKENSLAFSLGTFGALFYLYIFLGLLKYKEIKKRDKILFFIAPVILVLMIFSKYHELIFLLASVFSLGTIATQPLEMGEEEDNGVLEIRMVYAQGIMIIALFIYSFSFNNLVLEIISILTIPLLVYIIYTYTKNKRGLVAQ